MCDLLYIIFKPSTSPINIPQEETPLLIEALHGTEEDVMMLIGMCKNYIRIILAPLFSTEASAQIQLLFPRAECYGKQATKATVQHKQLQILIDRNDPNSTDIVQWIQNSRSIAIGNDEYQVINDYIVFYPGNALPLVFSLHRRLNSNPN